MPLGRSHKLERPWAAEQMPKAMDRSYKAGCPRPSPITGTQHTMSLSRTRATPSRLSPEARPSDEPRQRSKSSDDGTSGATALDRTPTCLDHAGAFWQHLSSFARDSLEAIYRNILLLSIPSHPCCFHDLEQLQKHVEHDCTVEDAWWQFTDDMLSCASRSTRHCLCIIVINVALATFLQWAHLDNFHLAVTRTAIITCVCCCLVCLTIVWCMRYHLQTMRARWDAPYNFCEVTEHNALAPFVATPMLLAAPKAWRIWVYFAFALVVVIVVWSATFGNIPPGGPSEALHHLGNATAEVFLHPAMSEGYPSIIDADHVSPFIHLPVILVAVIGLLHIGFTCKYFSKLGYPLSRQEAECQAYTRRRCRPRSREGRGGHLRNVSPASMV